jgi:hypothetical protein
LFSKPITLNYSLSANDFKSDICKSTLLKLIINKKFTLGKKYYVYPEYKALVLKILIFSFLIIITTLKKVFFFNFSIKSNNSPSTYK